MNITKKKLLKTICVIIIGIILALTFAKTVYKAKPSEDIAYNMTFEGLYNNELQQYFVCNRDNLASFAFKMINYDRENQGNMTVSLIDVQNNFVIDTWDYSLQNVPNGGYCTFELDEVLKDVYNKEYCINIKINAQGKNNCVGVLAENREKAMGDYVVVDGNDYNQSVRMCYQISGFPHVSALIWIAVYFLILYVLYIILKDRISKEKWITFLIIGIGLAYVFVVPRMAIPDEPGHYMRAYEVAHGHFLSVKTENGGMSTVSDNLFTGSGDYASGKGNLYELQRSTFWDKLSKDEVQLLNANQALYSPFSYIVQAIAIFVVSHITSSAGMIFYSGRIAAFVVSCILLYLSLKMVPQKNRSILLIASMPMFFQEMISYSTDSMANILSIFLVAYCLYLRDREQKLKWYHLVTLGLTCFMVAMCKIVYLPLVLVVFIIPQANIGSRLRTYLTKFGIVGISGIANLVWLYISSGYLIETNPGVAPKLQVLYVLKHPFRFIQVIFNTFYADGMSWLNGMVGSSLGWLAIPVSMIVIFAFIALLVFDGFIATENEKRMLNNKEKIFILFIMGCIVGLTFASLYVQWTPLEHEYVGGIQGRYFIPLLFSLFMLIKKVKVNISNETLLDCYVPIILQVNVCAVMAIYCFYA